MSLNKQKESSDINLRLFQAEKSPKRNTTLFARIQAKNLKLLQKNAREAEVSLSAYVDQLLCDLERRGIV